MHAIITKEEKQYPSLLREIGNAPKKLHYKGEWRPETFEYCLAVVGTRRMTGYGKRATEELVGEIASAGITIVSGFMYGIDAVAHATAVRVGGRTIAVMPCGINVIHPANQEDLYYDILQTGGLVISEFEGDFQPALWTYPKRNRIVAGLSQATLVVEAGEKSGSLITANYAKMYQRQLFAVPGPITSEVAKGTSKLLKEGAHIATNAKDVLSYYREHLGFSYAASSFQVSRSANIQEAHKSSALEHQILEYLARESVDIDTLTRVLNVEASHLGSVLSLMQLSGAVIEEQGKYYVA